MADIFGVEYKQQITLNEKVQKSFIGGICSLLVISTSLAYFIYVLNEWISCNILPKSTNTMKVQNYSEITFDQDQLFEFSYWKYKSDQVDPFRLDRNILTPVGIYFINGIPQEPFSLIKENQTLSRYNTSLMTVDQVQLIQNSGFNKSLNYTKELMIVITICNQSLLNKGYQCASDQEIQDFFSSSVNFISFMLYLKQYNPYSQQFEIVKKEHYLTFDQHISHQGQLILSYSKATIDTGILFGKYSEMSYIYDAQLISSATQTSFWSTLLTQQSNLNLFIRLDPMSYDTQIVYPKLGEILAQVGSIASMLMIIQYVIHYYNEQLLECDFIDKVLQFYFIDYAKLKKSKVKMDQDTCKDLIQQAQKKLVYTNVIYELSRIQLFLLHQFGRTQLQQTHQYGLHCKNTDLKYCCEAYDNFISSPQKDNQNPQDNNEFEKADFNLLCKAKSMNTVVAEEKPEKPAVVFQEAKSLSLKSLRI